MGGRGSSGGASTRAAGDGSPRLNADLVRRANDASFAVDAGDATSREYQRNVQAINGMNLSEMEKADAVKRLHTLTEAQLKAEGASVSPYTSGRAKLNTAQVHSRADAAVQRRMETQAHINSLQQKSNANSKASAQNALASGLQSAMASGALEATINGKTYYRSRKNSSTWRAK